MEFMIACPGLSGMVHMLQKGGLSFMEAKSFRNFNETIRLKLLELNTKRYLARPPSWALTGYMPPMPTECTAQKKAY